MDFDDTPSIPCRKIICPRCGKYATGLQEVWKDHVIDFNYKDGKRGRDGWLNGGDPYKVIASCDDCDYYWRVRGATQITDLDVK